MGCVPSPGVLEVNFNQRLYGQQVQNTIYVFRSAGWDTTSLGTQLGNLRDWFVLEMLPTLSVDLTLVEVAGRDLSVADGIVGSSVFGLPQAGTVASPAMPGNVALCVSFRTGLAGRSRRGRNYVAGIPTNLVVDNQAGQTLVDAVAAAYGLLASSTGPIQSEGNDWVVLSCVSGGLDRPEGVITEITSIIVQPDLDSQRRRLAGRGV